jgi:hypothetical protein
MEPTTIMVASVSPSEARNLCVESDMENYFKKGQIREKQVKCNPAG